MSITGNRSNTIKAVQLMGVSAAAMLLATPALAQNDQSLETVTVTGYRASLESALSVKRLSNAMVDAINAEDMAQFPDANLAESLQRLPGIAVDRDNGEGRQITVRGLGSDFTRVTVNGLEALSTAGTNDSGSSPNRSRGFDFNTFASELFQSLKVQKSSTASADEGSLGATVGLQTARPLDMNGATHVAFSAQNAWYEFGKPFNPRVAALAYDTFLGETLGVLVSVAYNSRSQYFDGYQRSPGSADYVYRGADYSTNFSRVSGFNNSSFVNRAGFAAPAGTSCSGPDGVMPGSTITVAAYCSILSGSDAAAYAMVNSPRGWTVSDTNTGAGTTSAITAPGALTRIPALPSYNHRELYQSRLGITASVQWQPSDDTNVALDALFAQSYQNSNNYIISTLGLNRNNTNSGLAFGTSTSGLWDTCQPQIADATHDEVACTYSRSLSIQNYYTTAGSPGYNAVDPTGYATRLSFIGRPATQLLGAHVTNGQADYLKLDRVDMETRDDQAWYATQFEQLSLDVRHDFTSRLRAEVLLGISSSRNHQAGFVSGMSRMDSGTGRGDNPLIYDATQGDIPLINFGFDVTDPSKWTFVKGFSAIRHYENYTANKYRTLRADLSYDLTDQFRINIGTTIKFFDFATSKYTRVTRDTVNPSLEEIGVLPSAVTKVVSIHGMNLPSGASTSYIVPDNRMFSRAMGFDCGCLNDFGDFRMTNKYLPSSGANGSGTYWVSEHDKSAYAQLEFQDLMIFGNPLRGEIGARFVMTDIYSKGYTLGAANTTSAGVEISPHPAGATLITASNSYNNILPSVNLVYSLTDDMLIRAAAAKVMARPLLGNLAPAITSLSVPSGAGATTGATMAIGNPKLSPYRANTIDLGWEWYFDKGAVLSIAGFAKFISNVPQTVVSSGHFSDFVPADQLALIAASYSAGTAQNTYVSNNNAVDVTAYQNAPGGSIKGVEVTYQQHLDFIPAILGGEGLGVNANFTHIESKLHYILNVSPVVLGDGPWIGASPDAWNLTVYYDGENWSGRVSSAFRQGYVSQYPISGGSCVPGLCGSPIINDFVFSRNTFNLDASFNYDWNDNISMTIDALNLTNQPDRRWAYMEQPAVTAFTSTGRQVYVGFRLKY